MTSASGLAVNARSAPLTVTERADFQTQRLGKASRHLLQLYSLREKLIALIKCFERNQMQTKCILAFLTRYFSVGVSLLMVVIVLLII